jgi:multiple sugar transport system permease protein
LTLAAPARTSPAGTPGAHGTLRARRARAVGPWLYLAPALAMLAVWVLLPLVATVGLSFLHWNLTTGHRPFAGLDNYRRLLTQPEFPHAAWRTVLYGVGLLPFATALPMAMAIVLWKHTGRFVGVYRALLFLPVVLAPVPTAISWQFVLDPLQGVLNASLAHLGVGPIRWLDSSSTALWVIVVITGMKIFSLNVLLYTAGLAGIERHYVEAARMDGATEWEVTRHVLIPLLGRTTAFVSFLCLVLAGQWAFVTINVLTQGGPQGATDNVYYRQYDYAFGLFDTGLASAAAVAIVVGLGVLALLHSLLTGGRLRGLRRRAAGTGVAA